MSAAEQVDCDTCGNETDEPSDRCPKSKMPCGHHCNHSWSHDACCWCGARWGEGGAFTPGVSP